MIKKEDVPQKDKEINLSEVKYTNRLFLDLLYNLSKYPHTQKAKQLVREGLFDFEKNNVFRTSKAKNKD